MLMFTLMLLKQISDLKTKQNERKITKNTLMMKRIPLFRVYFTKPIAIPVQHKPHSAFYKQERTQTS